MSSWRFAYASVAGTSHTVSGTPCQDYAECRLQRDATGQHILVAAAADGAGSACMSKDGALIAVERFLKSAGENLTQSKPLDKQFVNDWLIDFQHRILNEAAKNNTDTKAYSCTMLAAVVMPSEAIFFQIGDGAIVYQSSDATDKYELSFIPDKGEYANTTRFATDESALEYLHYRVVNHVNSVALFTDGIERLALDFKTSTAFEPFFRPMFAPLKAIEQLGKSEALSNALSSFLSSPTVNERTDDDKTLILATRL